MQKELTLFEKIKEAIRLSDTVGRSRGANCCATDNLALDKMVDLEMEIEDTIRAQAAEIAALRKALEFLIDVEDDTEKNPPEHRCYIEGTWKMAIDEARKAIAQAVQPNGE